MNLPLAAALVTALIELPLSKQYPTVPPTGTLVRMLVAGGVTYVAVVVAQQLTQKSTP